MQPEFVGPLRLLVFGKPRHSRHLSDTLHRLSCEVHAARICDNKPPPLLGMVMVRESTHCKFHPLPSEVSVGGGADRMVALSDQSQYAPGYTQRVAHQEDGWAHDGLVKDGVFPEATEYIFSAHNSTRHIQ